MNNKVVDIKGLQSLYIESMKWWDNYEHVKSKVSSDETVSILNRWQKCFEEIYCRETGVKQEYNDMHRKIQEAIARLVHDSGGTQCIGDLTLASWGYFTDLQGLLDCYNDNEQTRKESVYRYQLFSVLNGRATVASQMIDTYSILKSIVLELNKANIGDLISSIDQAMHAINDRRFSVEKISLLRTLLTIQSYWSSEEYVVPDISIDLLTHRVPLDEYSVPENKRTPVTLRWRFSGSEVITDGHYVVAIDRKQSNSVTFVVEDKFPELYIRERQTIGQFIEERIVVGNGDKLTEIDLELTIQAKVGEQYIDVKTEKFKVNIDYPGFHSGQMDQSLFAKQHKELAWTVIETLCKTEDIDAIWAIGSYEITRPYEGLVSAIRTRKALWHCRCAILKAKEIIELCKHSTHPADQIFNSDGISIVCSNRSLTDEEFRTIEQKWSGDTGKDGRILVIEQCTLDDLPKLREDRLGVVSTSRMLLDTDDDFVDVDHREDSDIFLRQALPDVTIDVHAREKLLDFLELFPIWKLRVYILNRVAKTLENRLPYIDDHYLLESGVWEEFVDEAVIDKQLFESDDPGHRRKLVIVFVALWNLYDAYQRAQSPGSIMNEIVQLLEESADGANRAVSFAFRPNELGSILDELCDKRLCVEEGHFLYAPQTWLPVGYVEKLKTNGLNWFEV